VSNKPERIDIHRPSAPGFDPQAYELAGVYDFMHGYENTSLGKRVEKLAAQGIVQAPHNVGTGGTCGHCGQTNLRYVAVLVRADIKEWIYVGQDCLIGRFNTHMTKAKFEELRKAAELARKKQAVKGRWLEFLAENPDMIWATYAENLQWGIERSFDKFAGKQPVGYGAQNLGTTAHDHFLASGLSYHVHTMNDIARKSRHYGEAWPNQVSLVTKLVGEMEAKVAKYAAKFTEAQDKPKVTLQVLGKRQVVAGTVLSRKWQDSVYGGAWKILVEQADGSRVWGSEPGAFVTGQGDKVMFEAAVSVSDKDPGFGFFKRPSQFKILESAAPASA
jgi:hypothetical protein